MDYFETAAAAILVAGLLFGFYVVAPVPYDGGGGPQSSVESPNHQDSGDPDGAGSAVDGEEAGSVYGGGYGNATVGLTLSGEEADWESPDSPWFEEVAEDVGFVYSEDSGRFREGEVVAGVYVTDFDGDSREDLLALGDEPRLFENQGGEFTASDALPELDGKYTYALFFDHDNSGFEDLYLLSDDGSVFLENQGGDFREREVGLEVEYDSVRAAAAGDYNDDGCLDVFVVQAGDWEESRPAGFDTREVPLGEDNGNPNLMFEGDCGFFEEVTHEAGVTGSSWSLATTFADFTNDGLADVHVANDFNNDVLYLNEGNGSFERRVLPGFTNRNGMSSEVADVTGNGYLDIFVSNVYFGESGGEVVQRFGGRTEGNNLLLNRGDGRFRDGAEEYGVRKGGWGWAALLEDLDNSGDLDLFHAVGTGIDDYQFLWQGDGDGFTRLNSTEVGLKKASGFGVAALDFDGDGALDVAVANRGGRFDLYRNSHERGYLRIDLENAGNHTVIGSKVTVAGDVGSRTRVLTSNSDYMSQSSRVLHFGLEDDSSIDVEVEFASGEVSYLEGVSTNSTVVVSEEGFRYR